MTEQIILSEIYRLPESMKQEVLHFIAFLKETSAAENQPSQKPKGKRVLGRVKGKYTLAPDFDAPLNDF